MYVGTYPPTSGSLVRRRSSAPASARQPGLQARRSHRHGYHPPTNLHARTPHPNRIILHDLVPEQRPPRRSHNRKPHARISWGIFRCVWQLVCMCVYANSMYGVWQGTRCAYMNSAEGMYVCLFVCMHAYIYIRIYKPRAPDIMRKATPDTKPQLRKSEDEKNIYKAITPAQARAHASSLFKKS